MPCVAYFITLCSNSVTHTFYFGCCRIKEVAIGKFTASNVGPASRVVAPDSAASTSISISLEEGEEPDED